ncbi:hypothetical protein Golax_023130 [Gossypium laxum]|uniref:RNase H type-1 domain-containing protein n=1 Tax=Gossypium laxum TaxID=34288 RepID=A0A7J9B335_9ROSI|nr:hypothetical protein [Gossypium laxum]
MKFNLDGAWKFGAKKAGLGGVLRDYERLVRGLFYGSILTSSLVEAISVALQLFSSYPWLGSV